MANQGADAASRLKKYLIVYVGNLLAGVFLLYICSPYNDAFKAIRFAAPFAVIAVVTSIAVLILDAYLYRRAPLLSFLMLSTAVFPADIIVVFLDESTRPSHSPTHTLLPFELLWLGLVSLFLFFALWLCTKFIVGVWDMRSQKTS